MANAGINKAQVKKAVDALIASGIHPSIDSVRVGLQRKSVSFVNSFQITSTSWRN